MSDGLLKRQTLLICAGLFAVTLAVFWPVTRAEFVSYDDPYYILNNPMVQQGVTAETVQWAFTTRHASNWHPVTWLSHMVDVRVFGLNAGGHHLTNLLLHGANAVLVFLLVQLLTGAQWRSAVVAGLFALHPLHVESVAWIAERKDVLCAFFGLLSLIAYAKYANAERGVRNAEHRLDTSPCPLPDRSGEGNLPARPTPFSLLHSLSSHWYWLALLCFALGLMSKPMLVTWPFVMLLLDEWPLKRARRWEIGVGSWERERQSTPHPTLSPGEAERARQRSTFNSQLSTLKFLVLEKLPFFALTCASCLLTLWAQQKAVAGTDALPLWARLGNSALAYATYLFKTVWPTDLIVHYPMADKLSLLMVTIAVILMCGITTWVWCQRQRRPYLLTGWLWFLGTLVPVIGLVQVGGQAMGDRYTYLPLIGIFLLLVWGAHELATTRVWPKELVQGIAAAILIGCALLARNQLDYWRTSVALFEHALEVAPNSFIALDNLGYSYLEKNDPKRAEEVLTRALAILPNNPGTRASLGRALLMQGRAEEALPHYETARKLSPEKPEAIYSVGTCLAMLGQFDAAIAKFEEALQMGPQDRRPYRDLAMALDEKGEPGRALAAVGEYLQTFPQDANARLHQACLLDEIGQTATARAAAQQALALQPALLNQLYAAAPQLAAAGKLKLAEQCHRSLVLLQPEAASAHALYGNFLVAQGRWEPGLNQLREALRLQPDAQNHYLLAVAELAHGEIRSALERLRAAVRLQPDWPLALNELAWQLATQPDAEMRNGAESVKLAERACGLTEYKEARFVGTMDAAYAEAGRFEEAIKTAEKARALATASGQTDIAESAAERLAHYATRKPYRQTRPEQK